MRTILILYNGKFGRRRCRKREKKKWKIDEKNKKTIDKSGNEWYYINMNGITIPFSQLFSQVRGREGYAHARANHDRHSPRGDKF